MEDINAIVDKYDELQARIFAHVGYYEDWKVIPLDDQRDMYWCVDKAENHWVKFSTQVNALAYWLEENPDEYGPYGDVLYQNVIYTQRHLPKWVYRGAELTIVCADTQTDGNKVLMILRNDHEYRVPHLTEVK